MILGLMSDHFMNMCVSCSGAMLMYHSSVSICAFPKCTLPTKGKFKLTLSSASQT